MYVFVIEEKPPPREAMGLNSLAFREGIRYTKLMVTREQVVEVIKGILDPDLFIDIWTLGLIYDIRIDEGRIDIEMTFTSIACPSGPMLVEEVQARLKQIPGVTEVNVRVVFSPPWEPSEELKSMLGIG